MRLRSMIPAGRREPEIHHRHQALAAGEHPRLALVAAEDAMASSIVAGGDNRISRVSREDSPTETRRHGGFVSGPVS